MEVVAAAVKPSEEELVSGNPIRTHPKKPLHFTNGFLKLKSKSLAEPFEGAYKECLRNHAAAMGGHALDGCGEFMPSPDETTLLCSVCGCHRNFHRRENLVTNRSDLLQVEFTPHNRHHPFPPSRSPSSLSPPSPLPISSAPPPIHDNLVITSKPEPLSIMKEAQIEFQTNHRHYPPPLLSPNSPSPPSPRPISSAPPQTRDNFVVKDNQIGFSPPSPPPISSSYYPPGPNMLLSLNNNPNPNSNPSSRKRFRTKFTHSQKTKMYELAEKIGWRMQRREDDIIDSSCNEIGVEKGVFKVWMHNNKNTLGKKEIGTNGGSNGVGINLDNPPMDDNYHFNHANNNVSANLVGTNGSSSSS